MRLSDLFAQMVAKKKIARPVKLVEQCTISSVTCRFYLKYKNINIPITFQNIN